MLVFSTLDDSWKKNPSPDAGTGGDGTPPKPPTQELRAAFFAQVRKFEADLLRLGRRLCMGDEDRAQDLMQDTLVRAYQAYLMGKFQGTTVKPWLMRILTNLFINDYQRRKKFDANVDFDTLTASGETGPSQTHAAASDVPGARLMANTLDEELEMALNMLPDALRMCVVLVDMEGMEYVEAAQILNVPVGTIRSRLSRARMRLHDLLQDFARRKGLI